MIETILFKLKQAIEQFVRCPPSDDFTQAKVTEYIKRNLAVKQIVPDKRNGLAGPISCSLK